MLYRVVYQIVPAGVGPDDYEPHELPRAETVLELSDPEPMGMVGDQPLEAGPSIPEVKRAIRTAKGLDAEDEPIILSVEYA